MGDKAPGCIGGVRSGRRKSSDFRTLIQLAGRVEESATCGGHCGRVFGTRVDALVKGQETYGGRPIRRCRSWKRRSERIES